jgi:hypothetical protein
MHLRARLVFIAGLIAASANPASLRAADDISGMRLEDLLRVEVQGASRYAQPLAEAPSAVTLIPAADIRRFGFRDIGEALQSAPGVYTSQDRAYSYLGVRGFSRPGDYNTRILLLVDGARSNDPLLRPGPDRQRSADRHRLDQAPGVRPRPRLRKLRRQRAVRHRQCGAVERRRPRRHACFVRRQQRRRSSRKPALRRSHRGRTGLGCRHQRVRKARREPLLRRIRSARASATASHTTAMGERYVKAMLKLDLGKLAWHRDRVATHQGRTDRLLQHRIRCAGQFRPRPQLPGGCRPYLHPRALPRPAIALALRPLRIRCRTTLSSVS